MSVYSKQDTKNKAVFSEFLILDLSGLTWGGIYLGVSALVPRQFCKSLELNGYTIPFLFPDDQPCSSLNKDANGNLAE